MWLCRSEGLWPGGDSDGHPCGTKPWERWAGSTNRDPTWLQSLGLGAGHTSARGRQIHSGSRQTWTTPAIQMAFFHCYCSYPPSRCTASPERPAPVGFRKESRGRDPQTPHGASQPGGGRQRIDGAAAERHLGSWVPSSQGCWRSVTMATLNELNLVTDPYLFLICGPFGTLAGNQLENNPVTYQKENYLYLFIQVELVSPSDAPRPAHITRPSRTPSPMPQDLCPAQPTEPWARPCSTNTLPTPRLAQPRGLSLCAVTMRLHPPLLGSCNIWCWDLVPVFLCAFFLRWNMTLLWNIFIWSRMAQHWCLLWAEDCLITSCIPASSLWQFYYYKFSRDMRAVHCG